MYVYDVALLGIREYRAVFSDLMLISINLLVFYYESYMYSLIGNTTHYVFCCRYM